MGNATQNSTLLLETQLVTDPNDTAVASYESISCFLAWSTLLACIFGIFSNTLSMIVFVSPSMRQTPINLLLFGMSGIDFLLCLLALFVFVVPEFYGCYRSTVALFLSSYSIAYIYPLTSTCQTASIWLFLAVSYERWSVVCGNNGQGYRPAAAAPGVNGTKERRRAIIAVLAVLSLSLAYNLVRFFEYNVISVHDKETGAILHRAEDRLKTPEANPNYRLYLYLYYVGLFLLTHFAGPFVAMVVVNGLILKVIYIAQRRRRQLLTKKEKKEHRTSLMMAIVILMFLTCHALPFVLNVIESIDSGWFYGDDVVLAFALNDISNLIIVVNAAAAALIYYHFNRSYHETCRALFKSCYPLGRDHGLAANVATCGETKALDEVTVA